MKSGFTIANRYRLDSKIGQGGFGSVWRAVDLTSGSHVALKMLQGRWITDVKALKRFKNEYVALAQLTHPNVIQVKELVPIRGSYAIVMPYLTGGSLAERLRLLSWLPIDTVINMALKLLSALEATAELGIIHRDIKPDNIVFADQSLQLPHLVDFGLAHLPDEMLSSSRPTTSPQIMGTLLYMSPEQLNGDALDIRSDLYSLGMTLYRSLTGRLFFDEQRLGPIEIQSLISRPTRQDPRKFREEIPVWLGKLITSLIAFQLYQRPETPRAVIETIRRNLRRFRKKMDDQEG
jgi:eukaryotic-like serine/threonine-protein kinase